MLRRSTPSSASLVGGDLSVDILHTEDSVRLGDGTNLMGLMALVGSVRALPIDILQTVGVMPANLTSGTQRSKLTDGTDNVEIATVGSEKALKVSVIASVGGGGGGTAATDSAAFTATASMFTPIGGHLDDVTSDALAEGEMGAVRMTSGRALHVFIAGGGTTGLTDTELRATALPVSIAGTVAVSGPLTDTQIRATALPVSGTFFQATQPVSIAGTVAVSGPLTDTQIRATALPVSGTFFQATQPVSGTFFQATQPTSSTAANAKVDVGLINGITPLMGTGATGTGSLRVTIATDQVNLTTPLNVNQTQMNGVATLAGNGVTGTGSQRVTIASDNTAFTVIGTGNVAHDGVASGNPVRVAGKAMVSAAFTSVISGDVCDIATDNQGRQIVTPYAPRDFIAHQTTTITASVTETTIFTAGAAGVFLDLTQITITNSSATALIVSLRDATAGTIRAIYAIAANGGIVITPTVPINQAVAASAWSLTCGTSVSSLYVYVQAVRRLA